MRQAVFSVTEAIYETVPPNNFAAKIFPQMIPTCDIATSNGNQAERKNEYPKNQIPLQQTILAFYKKPAARCKTANTKIAPCFSLSQSK